MADKTEYEPVDTGEGKKKVILRQVLLSLALKGCNDEVMKFNQSNADKTYIKNSL